MTSVHCSDIQISTIEGNADYTSKAEGPSTEKLGGGGIVKVTCATLI